MATRREPVALGIRSTARSPSSEKHPEAFSLSKTKLWKPARRLWVSNGTVRLSRNFFLSLAAVVLGNLIYFLIMPHLPPAAQHRSYRLLPDLGLLIDFWICLVLYGLLAFLFRPQTGRPPSEQRR